MKARLFKKEDLGKRAYFKEVEVGKWFKFDVLVVGEDRIGYGKVVAINEDGSVEVEKYFELPTYRPYAAHNWFDNLPMAVAK